MPTFSSHFPQTSTQGILPWTCYGVFDALHGSKATSSFALCRPPRVTVAQLAKWSKESETPICPVHKIWKENRTYYECSVLNVGLCPERFEAGSDFFSSWPMDNTLILAEAENSFVPHNFCNYGQSPMDKNFNISLLTALYLPPNWVLQVLLPLECLPYYSIQKQNT